MMPEKLRVAVILVNWNGYKDTAACLESFRRINYNPLKVVVVDNNSSEAEGIKLKESFPEITLIQNKVNRGFAGANNDGLKWAKQNGFEAAWVLNNDTVVDPDSLRCQIKHFRKNDIAAVGSKILFFRDEHIWSRGVRLLDFSCKFPFVHFFSNIGEGESDKEEKTPRDIPYISGCSILLRTDNPEAYFDEKYFAYCEDMDLCFRLRKKGYRLIYEPGSIIRHKVSKSTGGKKYNPTTLYYSTRNKLYFFRDHLGVCAILLLPIYGLNLVQITARILLFSPGRKDLIKAVFIGFIDGMKYYLNTAVPQMRRE